MSENLISVMIFFALVFCAVVYSDVVWNKFDVEGWNNSEIIEKFLIENILSEIFKLIFFSENKHKKSLNSLYLNL
jgi:hypothetical protein